MDTIEGAVVVVFEGNAILRLSVEALLESWGCHVVSGDRPDDILQAIQEEGVHPDVMLISPQTDRNTGAQVASRVEAEVGHPIPALSITEDPGLLRQRQGDGTVLEMPCSPDALHAAIVQAIARNRAIHDSCTS
ncbi:hypothetical protein [Azospirillum doebereinerae]|uniref:Response regulatory domain-containing protein n=1 Tax=Azospirillum doebereinerae TaxID=92933 RepID=A0A3S0WR81_9PROT|nr:hypothetical protein [Azospirillum doebereinerae]MCG5242467.1 hypothetical protein [Azospirillum doebereinerae]RUQ63970.1 hypothetical protein EJ913_26970 [Azospirillum doebereinerae]